MLYSISFRNPNPKNHTKLAPNSFVRTSGDTLPVTAPADGGGITYRDEKFRIIYSFSDSGSPFCNGP
ncbi:hypothetical protein Hanom_Chr10g00887771 [Helianthus anomalus]